ncbi:hypothetical protein C8T65DRAFT_23986 [Cerioporus squamosus]|nr:hypothetical protein C8T65DRAFT_23986 [Cerioporus squamosus]
MFFRALTVTDRHIGPTFKDLLHLIRELLVKMPCQLGRDPCDAYYDTESTTIVSHTLVLEDDERALNVPEDLVHRVDSRTYTWRILFADHTPEVNPLCGRVGDVWVTKADGEENIWIKTEGHSWNVWHKRVDYGAKKWNDSPVKFQHSYHPWLRDRLLQFSGSTLGWFPRSQYHQHRHSWNNDKTTRVCLNAAAYDALDVPWIARHISSLVLPATPDATHSRTSWPSSSSTANGVPPSEDPDLIVTAEPDSKLSIRAKRRRSASAVEDDARKRPCPPGETSSNPARDPPPHIPMRSLAPVSAPVPPPPPPGFDLEQYLAALPMSLSEHVHLFAALGFTDRAHFDSVALMPQRFSDKVIATLRERGLTFMGTLVLRNALNTIRRTAAAEQTSARADPDSIRTFLARLCPLLERHAPIFHDLGIEVIHIPVLAQLDTDAYAEFENTLMEKGLTWLEVFMISTGTKSFVQGRQEPLLLAV